MKAPVRSTWFGLVALALWVVQGRTAVGTPPNTVSAQPGSPVSIPLTNIIDIMRLPREVAAQELPVDIQGVVTCTYSANEAFFINDGLAGVYVSNTETLRHFSFGELVRVKGRSSHGSFCPMVRAEEVQSLGFGSVPPPRPVAFATLASGSADSQWLEIRGVVQAVSHWPSDQGVTLDFSMEGGMLQVLVECPHPPDLNALVDAEAKIRGVASGSFNKKGQMVAPVFRVANMSLVEVEKAAQTNWSELALKPINQLLLFSPVASLPHRVRVRGVVTGCQPGQSVFLRDGSDSLKVETGQPADFQPGEVLEVAGFPAMSPYSAELRNALCRRIGREPPPQPSQPTLESILGGLHDAELIKLQAKLLDWVVDDNGITLALQAERCLFKGYLHAARAPSSWAIEKNSLVELTGICDIKELQKEVWYYQPRSFSLLMRSADDLSVVQRPPWLNATRLGRLVSILSVLLATAGMWVWALRKEVNHKRRLIEHQAKRFAVMEERTRIARELHDTVEQGLTGLSLQLKSVELDSTGAEPKLLGKLQLARRMLRNTKALTHYAVQELRHGSALRETLTAGLERTAQYWNRTGAMEVRLRLPESTPLLPPDSDATLLAVAREAMTNAVKHGQATAIELELRILHNAIQLLVKDNGSGFDVIAPAENGHFGLQGMRERLQAVGGILEIHSQPGQGTELCAKVPTEPDAQLPNTPMTRTAPPMTQNV